MNDNRTGNSGVRIDGISDFAPYGKIAYEINDNRRFMPVLSGKKNKEGELNGT